MFVAICTTHAEEILPLHSTADVMLASSQAVSHGVGRPFPFMDITRGDATVV